MSLLQKASIITTPTAYAEDYLYSIKPAYALGSELVTNGDFATDSDWTKGGSWIINNGKASIDYNDGSDGRLTQGISFTQNKTYKVVFTISNYVSGNFRIEFRFGGSSTVSSNFNANGTYTLYLTAGQNHTQFSIRSLNNPIGSIDNVSVKEVTDADFDFDRNSTGTRVNEDYLIEDVPYNLVPKSEQFDQSNWSKTRCTITANQAIAPDGTLTADLMTATGDDARLNDYVGSSGQKYTQSIYVKSAQATDVAGQIDFVGLNIVTFTANQNWKRITSTLTDTSISPSVRVRITNNGDALHIWGAQLVKGDQPKDYLKTTDRLDIPRIDYTNGEPSILLEKSRTNLITSSTDYSNSAWSKTNLSITTNSATSPEGITNASLLTENSSNAQHFIGDSLSLTSGTSYSVSIYAKKKERSVLQISPSSSHIAASYANYDLDSGVVSATGGSVTAEIQSLNNDWYRCILTFTVSLTATATLAFFIQTSTTASRGASYQGDGSSGLYLYGAQIEAGSYATSLIHTSGSTVTRSSDVANNAGNSDLFNDSEGVLYAEIAALSNVASHRRITISDGTNNNRIVVGYNTTLNQIFYFVKVGGSTVASGNYTPINITEFKKIAIKYKVNDFAFYVDGIVRHTDSSGAVFSANTLNSLQFAQGSGDDLFFLGRAKMVAVFKEALTDLELEKLTGYNNHELYMNYYNRLSYLGLVEEYNVESDINNYIL